MRRFCTDIKLPFTMIRAFPNRPKRCNSVFLKRDVMQHRQRPTILSKNCGSRAVLFFLRWPCPVQSLPHNEVRWDAVAAYTGTITNSSIVPLRRSFLLLTLALTQDRAFSIFLFLLSDNMSTVVFFFCTSCISFPSISASFPRFTSFLYNKFFLQ